MTKKQMERLYTGDIICHKDKPELAFIVSANFGERIIAVRTIEIRDPNDWVLLPALKTKKKTVSAEKRHVCTKST
jgi:hypothetical protein